MTEKLRHVFLPHETNTGALFLSEYSQTLKLRSSNLSDFGLFQVSDREYHIPKLLNL